MIAYAGIDVAFAKGKRLPICICTWRDGRLMPLPLKKRRDIVPPRGYGNRAALDPKQVETFAHAALEYLQELEHAFGLHIRTVAIDAPRAPKQHGIPRRSAECAMDKRRISCFATPSNAEFEAIHARARAHLDAGGELSRIPHANQLWMLVGFALFNVLSRVYRCIEVFPQTTVAALGAGGLHKSNQEGFRAQLAAIAHATGWPRGASDEPDLDPICYGSRHDKLDAYLSAWVAALPEDGREACGEAEHDVIWIPRVDAAPTTA